MMELELFFRQYYQNKVLRKIETNAYGTKKNRNRRLQIGKCIRVIYDNTVDTKIMNTSITVTK